MLSVAVCHILQGSAAMSVTWVIFSDHKSDVGSTFWPIPLGIVQFPMGLVPSGLPSGCRLLE